MARNQEDTVDGMASEPLVESDLEHRERVAAFLQAQPDFLAAFLDSNPDLLPQQASVRRHRPDGAIDLQGYMVGRLRDEVTTLNQRLQEVLANSRSNMTAQSRTHSAVLSLLAADTFEELIETVTGDLAVILDVDVVTLCIESEDGAQTQARTPGVQVLHPGTIDLLLGPQRDFRLEAHAFGEPEVFGHGAGLVRSQALMRLSVSPQAPLAMLALGSRRPAQFEDGQGTELLSFLGAVLELSIRSWLDIA